MAAKADFSSIPRSIMRKNRLVRIQARFRDVSKLMLQFENEPIRYIMNKKGTLFWIELSLPIGKHHFKFITPNNKEMFSSTLPIVSLVLKGSPVDFHQLVVDELFIPIRLKRDREVGRPCSFQVDLESSFEDNLIIAKKVGRIPQKEDVTFTSEHGNRIYRNCDFVQYGLYYLDPELEPVDQVLAVDEAISKLAISDKPISTPEFVITESKNPEKHTFNSLKEALAWCEVNKKKNPDANYTISSNTTLSRNINEVSVLAGQSQKHLNLKSYDNREVVEMKVRDSKDKELVIPFIIDTGAESTLLPRSEDVTQNWPLEFDQFCVHSTSIDMIA